LHQALGEAFDSADIRRIASLWTIAGFVGTVALEFYGGIRLLQWAGLPFLSALPLALLLAFVIGAFTASGGLRGVAYADIFLTSLSVISIGLLIWMASRVYSLNYVTELSPSAAPYPPLGDNVLFAIGMGVIFLPFQFCILDSWQRFAAWKGSTSSSKPLWVLWTGLILSILFCIPVFLGVLVRAVDLPVTPQGHPLLSLLTAVHLPTGVMGLLFAGMFAAMFSTADELLNCCSMSFLGDALQLHIDDKPAAAAADKLALSGQFYIGVFAVLSAALALFAVRFDRKISEMAVAVFSGQILFTVPILVALFRPAAAKAYGTAAKAALAIGFSSVLACVAISWLNDYRLLADSAPLLGLALSAISFAAIASLSKLRKAK
jgi:Na+/proline symporter